MLLFEKLRKIDSFISLMKHDIIWWFENRHSSHSSWQWLLIEIRVWLSFSSLTEYYCNRIFLLQTYFSNYVKEFKRVLVNIREKCKTSQSSLESEDWSNFQHSLRVIQTCGDLIMHVDDFDGTIISTLMHSVGQQHIPTSPGKETGIFR